MWGGPEAEHQGRQGGRKARRAAREGVVDEVIGSVDL